MGFDRFHRQLGSTRHGPTPVPDPGAPSRCAMQWLLSLAVAAALKTDASIQTSVPWDPLGTHWDPLRPIGNGVEHGGTVFFMKIACWRFMIGSLGAGLPQPFSSGTLLLPLWRVPSQVGFSAPLPPTVYRTGTALLQQWQVEALATWQRRGKEHGNYLSSVMMFLFRCVK